MNEVQSKIVDDSIEYSYALQSELNRANFKFQMLNNLSGLKMRMAESIRKATDMARIEDLKLNFFTIHRAINMLTDLFGSDYQSGIDIELLTGRLDAANLEIIHLKAQVESLEGQLEFSKD